ncbi:MAG: bifunctional DNA-formamidopyrimidine glycosylase/DNA-(apurinic or apyrimidinic site) lyase [Aquihabitans sp.]
MPELPEVETVRRGLEPVLLGRTFVDAGAHPSAKFNSAPGVIDRTVRSVGRRGKYLLIGLDDGRRLVVHLGMTGQFRVHEGEPAEDPHVRAWWLLDDGRTLAFRDVRRFGRIAVVGTDVSALPTLAALGPEPFDPAFTAEWLRDAVNRSQARVKTQLLGQRVVAGVGNIYADEALWRARVHPASRRITLPAARRLQEAVVDVLAEGIDHGGTTLRDYRTVEGGEGENQHHLECYGRAGLPCTRCGTVLKRSVIDGRGTTHCPTCQRRS